MKTYKKSYVYSGFKFEILCYLNYQSTGTPSTAPYHKIIVNSGNSSAIPNFEVMTLSTDNLSDTLGSILQDIQNKVDKFTFDNKTIEGAILHNYGFTQQ